LSDVKCQINLFSIRCPFLRKSLREIRWRDASRLDLVEKSSRDTNLLLHTGRKVSTNREHDRMRKDSLREGRTDRGPRAGGIREEKIKTETRS